MRCHRREKGVKFKAQAGIAQVGPAKFCAGSLGVIGNNRWIKIQHSPTACSASDRQAVMHLSWVDSDNITCLNRNQTAPTVQSLRTLIKTTKPELIMRVARERPVASGRYRKNCW